MASKVQYTYEQTSSLESEYKEEYQSHEQLLYTYT